MDRIERSRAPYSPVPRENGSAMARAEATAVRPDLDCPDGVELRLRAALLPLHVRLDQHALTFLREFFGAERGGSSADASGGGGEGGGLTTEAPDDDREEEARGEAAAAAAEAGKAYFQLVEVRATSVRFDYCPRAVDVAALRAGHLAEALNLVPFGGVTLDLVPVSARGVQGWDAVGGIVVRSWLEHVARTQAMKFAAGIAPIRSVCNVGAGAASLVSAPLEFRRSGRRGGALRGATAGVAAFVRAVSGEALGLGVQLAAGATAVMGGIEEIVAVDGTRVGTQAGGDGGEGGLRAAAAAAAAAAAEGKRDGREGAAGDGSSEPKPKLKPKPRSASMEVEDAMAEPAGLREGLYQAAATLSLGIGAAAAAVKEGPLRRYREGDGVRSAVVSAVRTAPAAVAAPVAAATAAVHRALLGARNQLVADTIRGEPVTGGEDEVREVDADAGE